MSDSIKQRVLNYTKYLRNKLLEAGCDKAYVHSLSDSAILEDFRKCADCGDELITRDQQMHAIYEFDTPERIFEVTYEHLELQGCEDADSLTLDISERIEGKDNIPDILKELIALTKELVGMHKAGKKITKPTNSGIISYE